MLNFDAPAWVPKLQTALAFGHEMLPSGIAFLAFCGLAYLIVRAATAGSTRKSA